MGTITKLRIDGVDVVTENNVLPYDLEIEDVEGVLGMDENGRTIIASSSDEAKWVTLPTFLHSGPLLLLDGVRQPLDNKRYENMRVCAHSFPLHVRVRAILC